METSQTAVRTDTLRAPPGLEFEDRALSHGTPATPLFGVLPFRRIIPMDLHALLLDYMGSAQVLTAGLLAWHKPARRAGIALGAGYAAVSLLTDYRLSAAKLIPIKAHEVIDHLWGLSLISAPFIFGYRRKSRMAALVHIMTGVVAIVGSLMTDYRAYKGEDWRATPEPFATGASA